MKNNRLVLILLSFSKKEMTYFKEFIDSPYFNKHKGVKALTDYFAKIYPNFTDKNCKPETIYKSLFGKAKFDKQKLALLFTYSMRLLEKFMAQEVFKSKSTDHKLLANVFLRDKKNFRFAEKLLTQMGADLESDTARDTDYLRLKLFQKRAFNRNDTLRGIILKSPHLEEKQFYLDAFFLAEKMRDACEMVARSRILKKDTNSITEHFGVKELLTHPQKYESAPAVRIYIQIFKMLSSGEVKEYQTAKDLINELDIHFPQTETQNFYNYLQNFCVSKINKLEPGFYAELFELYKILLEKELIFENGILSEWNYKNIVTVGTRLNERAWVENFLVDYKKRLRPDRAENAYSFNLASYYFSIGELEKVQQLLHQVEYTDPRYSLGAKALLLQTYYQMEETEPLFSLADSFRQFLKRNNLLAESRKSGYANLFKLTKRTAKIRSRIGFVGKTLLQKDFEKLKNDFEVADRVFYKSWLQKKIDELGERL